MPNSVFFSAKVFFLNIIAITTTGISSLQWTRKRKLRPKRLLSGIKEVHLAFIIQHFWVAVALWKVLIGLCTNNVARRSHSEGHIQSKCTTVLGLKAAGFCSLQGWNTGPCFRKESKGEFCNGIQGRGEMWCRCYRTGIRLKGGEKKWFCVPTTKETSNSGWSVSVRHGPVHTQQRCFFFQKGWNQKDRISRCVRQDWGRGRWSVSVG